MLVVPDKDADGLGAGVIGHRTLVALGKREGDVEVHLVGKGRGIHDRVERERMRERGAGWVFVVDQGSRRGPAVVDGASVLIVDHHLSNEFPEGATVRRGVFSFVQMFSEHREYNDRYTSWYKVPSSC